MPFTSPIFRSQQMAIPTVGDGLTACPESRNGEASEIADQARPRRLATRPARTHRCDDQGSRLARDLSPQREEGNPPLQYRQRGGLAKVSGRISPRVKKRCPSTGRRVEIMRVPYTHRKKTPRKTSRSLSGRRSQRGERSVPVTVMCGRKSTMPQPHRPSLKDPLALCDFLSVTVPGMPGPASRRSMHGRAIVVVPNRGTRPSPI